jgi:CheY-specific phosphatase CheX
MNAIFEVFEKMFFVFLEPLDEEVKYEMVTSIKFSGPTTGEIYIFFTRGVAETMVQNMLGVDLPGVTDKLIEDCTKEAVNMVSGNFLQKHDSSKVFDLSIPVFEKKTGVFAPQTEAADKALWNLSFESSGSLMGVRMTIS